jgi:putative phosphoesterase
VLSDIHEQTSVLRNILLCETANPSRRPDYLIFLGDGLREFESLSYSGEFFAFPAVAVRGNCDFFGAIDTPELRELTLAEYRIMIMHGHRFEVKTGTDCAARFAVSKHQDLLLFGHTHVQKEIRYEKGDSVGGVCLEKPLVLFNPGSVSGGCYGVVTLSKDGIACEHKRQ